MSAAFQCFPPGLLRGKYQLFQYSPGLAISHPKQHVRMKGMVMDPWARQIPENRLILVPVNTESVISSQPM